MKANRLLLAGALVAMTAACVAERRPRPAPTPTAPPVVVAPVRPPADWRDAPLSLGDWSYAAEPAGSVARYGTGAGQPLLALRCHQADGIVALERSGSATVATPLTVTTTNGTRPFSAAPQPGIEPTVAVRLQARDPFLDGLAFSRGRFAVETSGLPTLYLPAWPEIGRVIEDCR